MAATASHEGNDLEIRIFQRQEQGYPVEITLGGQQEFPRGFLTGGILPWASSGDLAADGQELLDALLADAKLRDAWAHARGQFPKRRIRFRIDLTAAELHALPWELLHDGLVMLAAQADTPFSRYLPIALPWSGPVEERPIRVLVAISDPDDLQDKYNLPQADVALERQALQDAFAVASADKLKMDFLAAPVTLERLETKLREGYHILHFLGHGAFSARRGQAALYMQDAECHARRVLDDELVSMLARQGVQPRLVVLAACQSATRSSADAFLGLGPKLVSAGVPAVVAMQDFVTVETARKFSAAFYQRLLEHGQVDLAANEARSTLLTAGRPDAAVPVLFMRLKSGQLWGAEADARGRILGDDHRAQVSRVFWTTLLRRIQGGTCTPIVGPRVHGRWLPTTQQVAQRWAEANDYPFNDKDNLAHVSQYIDTTGGEDYSRDEWMNTLMAEFKARLPQELQPQTRPKTLTELVRAVGWQHLSAGNPNEVHRVLASLNLPLYLTTNPDSFMVEALAALKGSKVRRETCCWNPVLEGLTSPAKAHDDEPTPDAPLVFHLFGSDECDKSLVVTEDHYLDFLTNILTRKDRIPYHVRGKLAQSALLFIGYSLYDWEFRVIMRGLVATVDFKHEYKHVAVQLEDVREADEEAVRNFLQQYFQRAQINVFWGSPAQFIAELRERWEASHP